MVAKRVAKRIISNMFYYVSSLFYGRDRSVVLFGSWHGTKYADNTRNLYEYVSLHKDEIGISHAVWVTRNKDICEELCKLGFEAYMIDSPESVYYHKKAKLHIVCDNGYSSGDVLGDIEGKYSHHAYRLNLWHGIGLKGVNFASNSWQRKLQKNQLYKVYYQLYQKLPFLRVARGIGGWTDCHFLGMSETYNKIIQRYYLLPRRHLIVGSNYPRNCSCTVLLEAEKKVLELVKSHTNVILYLPTFRNDPNADLDIYPQLRGSLSGKKYLFIQKRHSADSSSGFSDSGDRHVITLDSDFDINVLIPHVDLLITDYSSCSFDAIYHRKSVVFYVPDLERYLNDDRGFVIDPKSVMSSGPVVRSIDELIKTLTSAMDDFSSLQTAEYESVRKRFWCNDKGLSEIWSDINAHFCLLPEGRI